MVVDRGGGEHEGEAADEKADLLVLKAVELGHRGGGANLDDGKHAQDEDQAEERPVEVTEAGAPHRGSVPNGFGRAREQRLCSVSRAVTPAWCIL